MKRLIILALITVSCASKYGDKKIDPTLDTKGHTTEGELGFDKKRDLVLQEKRRADAHYQTLVNVYWNLRDDLEAEVYTLNECRKDMARPENGGDGKYPEVSGMEKLKNIPQIKEDLGMLESGELIFTFRKNFKESVEFYTKTIDSFHEAINIVKRGNDICKFNLEIAKKRTTSKPIATQEPEANEAVQEPEEDLSYREPPKAAVAGGENHIPGTPYRKKVK